MAKANNISGNKKEVKKKVTSIGNSKRSKLKNKHKKRMFKKYNRQGK